MKEDFKDKYPIGSQWECRGGSRAVVVDYDSKGRLEVYYTLGKVATSECPKSFEKHHTPWKEKRVFEEVIMVGEHIETGCTVLICENELRNPLYKTIARKKITITEGEGIDD